MTTPARSLVVVYLGVAALAAGCNGAAGASANRGVDPQFKDLLPVLMPRHVQADTLVESSPPRLVELSNRVKAAWEADPQVMQEAFDKARPGQPLDYDERFGVTKAEYEELLRLSRERKLVKDASIPLEFQSLGDERYALSIDKQGFEPARIVFDAKSCSVETPLGAGTVAEPVKVTGNVPTLGPWHGLRWRVHRGSLDELPFTKLEVTLARLETSGLGYISIEVWQLADKSQKAATKTLRLLVPAAKAPG